MIHCRVSSLLICIRRTTTGGRRGEEEQLQLARDESRDLLVYLRWTRALSAAFKKSVSICLDVSICGECERHSFFFFIPLHPSHPLRLDYAGGCRRAILLPPALLLILRTGMQLKRNRIFKSRERVAVQRRKCLCDVHDARSLPVGSNNCYNGSSIGLHKLINISAIGVGHARSETFDRTGRNLG